MGHGVDGRDPVSARALCTMPHAPGPMPRNAPLDLPPDEFRKLGHALIERMARHFETINDRPITAGDAPSDVRELIGPTALAQGWADRAQLDAIEAELRAWGERPDAFSVLVFCQAIGWVDESAR